jgi:hypothetical protein
MTVSRVGRVDSAAAAACRYSITGNTANGNGGGSGGAGGGNGGGVARGGTGSIPPMPRKYTASSPSPGTPRGRDNAALQPRVGFADETIKGRGFSRGAKSRPIPAPPAARVSTVSFSPRGAFVTSFACPHCGSTDNHPGTLFCHACHKALPIPGAQPRLVEGNVRPATATAYQVQAEALTAQSGKGSGALLTVAIIQSVVGAILYLAASKAPGANATEITAASVFVIGIGVVFFVLYAWSRHHPLPANIVGLVLYVLVHLGDAMADPTALSRGLIFKIIIISVLCRAIAAGMKQRDLRQAEPVI